MLKESGATKEDRCCPMWCAYICSVVCMLSHVLMLCVNNVVGGARTHATKYQAACAFYQLNCRVAVLD
jgi:hypothetical protein